MKPWSALVVVLLLLAGCRSSRHHVRQVRHVDRGHREVVIARGHVHTAVCGHYRHEGRWYFARNHRHDAGCGHVCVRGVWLLEDE